MTEKIRKFSTGFTQVSNVVLTDPNLSLKAKAIYAYLFSKPDGWIFHVGVMRSEIKESKKVIRSAIKELINFGYLKRKQINEKGCFGGIEYEFIDVYRGYKNRATVKPHTEKRPTNNTNNISNKEMSNNPLYPPRGELESFKSLLRYFNQCSADDDIYSDEVLKQWRKFERWMRKNDLSVGEVIRMMNTYIKYRDEEFAPIVDSLGEMMMKWNRIVRFCENW